MMAGLFPIPVLGFLIVEHILDEHGFVHDDNFSVCLDIGQHAGKHEGNHCYNLLHFFLLRVLFYNGFQILTADDTRMAPYGFTFLKYDKCRYCLYAVAGSKLFVLVYIYFAMRTSFLFRF